MREGKEVVGLGGWLILVGINIVLAPIKMVIDAYPAYSQAFSSQNWALLTSPESAVYLPLWKPVVLGEAAINAMLFLAWFFIAYLFFTKKRIFPKCFIAILCFTLAFILIDAVAIAETIKSVVPREVIFDKETVKQLQTSFVAMMIWVPYMLISKRVKATFVR